LKRRRPYVTTAVGGRMVGEDHSELARRAPHVDHFFRPVQFGGLLARVEAPSPIALSPELLAPSGDGCAPDLGSVARPDRPTRWLSVIHGCNRACTYCIVPMLRG